MDKIGQVYTPFDWATWLIKKWGILDYLKDNKTICDPTAGEGVFILALLKIASSQGIKITSDLLKNIFLFDINPHGLELFSSIIKKEYNLIFPKENVLCLDIILETPELSFDVVIGNPPWCNFNELPENYKTPIKEKFIEEGLVANKQKTLLGSSRIDISALIVKIILGKLLKQNSKCILFIPTSLFLGEGAHSGFRNYVANQRSFSVKKVFEFSTTKIFGGVSTEYCCTEFISDSQIKFPIEYYKENNNNWIEFNAYPIQEQSDSWRIIPKGQKLEKVCINLTLPQNQKPRQGVNSCGAKNVFIFNQFPENLPKQFVYPLITKEVWKNQSPNKWVLLPHNKNGSHLTWNEIQEYTLLKDYLLIHKEKLVSRKGTLIQSMIKRGFWWGLIGVGEYSFSPYKVVWESYGKKTFNPIIVTSGYQGNQAMHAFIPCWSLENAKQIQEKLLDKKVEKFLNELNGGGKCNWAQPGKIKKLITFID